MILLATIRSFRTTPGGLVHLEHRRLAANDLAQRGVRGDDALGLQPEGSGHG